MPWMLAATQPILSPHPDLTVEGGGECESLIKHVQQPQELTVLIVKSFSKDNGADDVGGDTLEEECGVQESS
jgi:hypothetical protein